MAASAANRALLAALPFGDESDFADARREFIADTPHRMIDNPDGGPSFDLDLYGFVRAVLPLDTVNPR